MGMDLLLVLGRGWGRDKGKGKGKGQDRRLPHTDGNLKDQVYLLRTTATATPIPPPSRQRKIGEIYS